MAVSSKEPFQVSAFDQGLTDDPFDGDARRSITLDNFTLEPDSSLISRPGSVIEDLVHPQIPAGTERIGLLINYNHNANLLVQSLKKFYYRNPSSYTEIVGPTSNPVFSIGAYTNNAAFSQWNSQVYVTNDGFPIPMKIYKDSGGTLRVNNNGLPALASSPTVTPVAGANSYIYAFHYFFSYTVGSQTFEDVGPVTEVSTSAAAAPNVSPIAITLIPALSNGVTNNYATTTIKVQIYRTTNAGTVFYKVGEVTNGTTTFNDTMSDTTLQTQVLMYTEDGTIELDPVPLHKFVHIVNNIAYYGFIKDGSVEYPFRLRQSIPLAPSGAPEDFFIDLEDEIKGLGSVNSIPIVMCNRQIYRLEGSFDQFGRGGINPVRISDTAGCISHLSIVSAEGQIFWAGNDGFYASNGYEVIKISDKNNTSYRDMKEACFDVKRICGKFDEENRRICWGVERDSSTMDNDSFFVLDLRWGVRNASTFTTWSGTSFRATALEFFDNNLYRGDDNGYVYYHSADLTTDPRVDTAAEAVDWAEETIIWNYVSVNNDFGGTFFRKKPTRILLTARNIGNTSIQVNSIDNDGQRTRVLKPIRWRRNFVWDDPTFIWDNPDCVWNSSGVIEQWRRFPARGLRLSYCQIQVTNAYSVIANSDFYGLATFSGSANTAVLINSATYVWPDNSEDYYISTEVDDYSRQFKVLSMTSDTLTLVDSINNLPSGNLKWLLQGYKKGEKINLQGYCIHVANEDQNQMAYHTGDDGANA